MQPERVGSSFEVIRNVAVPVRDGVSLMTDLWLPASREPVAVVLIRTPYDKSQLHSDFLRPQHLVEAGFAAAVQDTRGRFASAGTFTPFMWEQEGLDGYDTIEWLAVQPWCSGAVGMAGTSYSGIVQLTAALQHPPHLRAIAPALAGTADDEQEETGGAFWLDHLFGWLCFVARDWVRKAPGLDELQRRTLADTVASFIRDPAILLSHRPLREAPLFKLPGFPLTFADVARRCVTPRINLRNITVPLLSVGGWFDLYVRGSIAQFQDREGLAERSLVMGPWAHSNLLPAIQGQCHFGPSSSGAAGAVPARHLDFFRRHLRNESVAAPRVRYFLTQSGRWLTAPQWPPPADRVQTFYLHNPAALGALSRGTLTPWAASDDEPPDSYVYDPADPTPSVGGRLLPLNGLIPGPVDQAPLAARNDVLCFDGIPQKEALAIVGAIDAHFYISVDAANIDLIVKLVDVAPDGRAYPITDGIARLSDLEPHAVVGVPMVLADTAWLVRVGHVLRVQIQSGNYPHIDPNMVVDGRAGQVAVGRWARVTVYHDAERPSAICLREIRWGERSPDDTL
jgi:hypothetical protein